MTACSAAQALARDAGPVLPLAGKVPVLANWPARATRDAGQIAALWLAHPDANVGLLTGERAGYFVLDVDGAEGLETLERFTLKHGQLPKTWTSHTGGGGVHLFFRWPGFPVRGSASKLGRKLDIRGEGGQVVAPPSVHPSGTAYRWAEGGAPGERPLADAPGWLLERLRPQPVAVVPSPAAPMRAQRNGTRDRKYVEGALSSACAKVAGAIEGQRNDTFNTEAFCVAQLVGGGALGRADAEDALRIAARACGLGEGETEKTLASAFGAGERLPRGVPAPTPRAAPREPGADDGDEQAEASSVFSARRMTLDMIRNPPREHFIVGPLFPFGKASVLYGPQGAGKSAFLSGLVFKVASGGGGTFLGMTMHDQEGGPVYVYSAEDTFNDWILKGAAIEFGFKDIDVGKALDRLWVNHKEDGFARLSEVIQVRSDDGTQSIVRRENRPTVERLTIIREATSIGARLIVLETASRLVEEEDNANFVALQAAAGHIAAATGAAVVISHHPTKNASKDNDSSPEGARGGGALINNSRTAVSLFPAAAEHITKLADKGLKFADEDVLVLEHQKGTSSVRKQAPIVLVRCGTEFGAIIELPELAAGQPRLVQGSAQRADFSARRKDELHGRIYDQVIEILKVGPASKNKLRDRHREIGCAKNDVDRHVDDALLNGVLVADRRDRAGRILSMLLGKRPRATSGDKAPDWRSDDTE